MHPTRPGPADAVRFLDVSRSPIGAKFDGGESHRMALSPEHERGLVSTMGPNGLFYANTVGTLRAVPSGGKWARLASAGRRWALKLVEHNELFVLFPDGALVLAASEHLGEFPLVVIFFLLILR